MSTFEAGTKLFLTFEAGTRWLATAQVKALTFAGDWTPADPGLADVLSRRLPWTETASRARLLAQSEKLLDRGSSEDALFAALFLARRPGGHRNLKRRRRPPEGQD